MKKSVSTGISDFKELIESNNYLVDKTNMIGEVLTDASKVLLFTRPRRFGKSLNMSMLYYYLSNKEESKEIFKGLNIDKEEIIKKDKFDNIVKIIKTKEYQNEYPVIFMSFKGIKANNWDDAYDELQFLITNEFNKHSYLINSDKLSNYDLANYKMIADLKRNENGEPIRLSSTTLKNSLKELTIMLEKHHEKRVYVIIDEYDTPIIKAHDNGYYNEMVLFMSNLFGEALKDNTSLEKGILTGILRIARESIFSDLNHLMVYSITDSKYSQYFGFIQNEVNEMCKYYESEHKLDEIKEWYDGYRFGKTEIYNPWSILSYLSNEDNELKGYWNNTSSNNLLYKLLNNANYDFKTKFSELIANPSESFIVPINENIVYRRIEESTDPTIIWTVLLMSGYLKLVERINNYSYEVMIPNREVAEIYENMFGVWLNDNIGIERLDRLINAMIKQDINTFEEVLSIIFKETSTTEYQQEGHYQNLFVGIMVAFRDKYSIHQSVNNHIGISDVILKALKKDKLPSMVIEFKQGNNLDNKANEAIEQIKDREYYSIFDKEQINNYICYGIAASPKGIKISLLENDKK